MTELSVIDRQYEDLLREVYTNGDKKTDRTGTGTFSLFGRELRYDLSDGTLPVITTKRVSLKPIIHELLWFLSGDSNIRPLLLNGVHIWTEWAFKKYLEATGQDVPKPNSQEWISKLKEFEARVVDDKNFADVYGDLGPVYGVQWRSWRGAYGQEVDQIAKVIEQLRNDPDSRRIIVSAWNVAELDEMLLMPCHAFFQFYVSNGKLYCKIIQRSSDMFLGVPFNITSYSLLVHMIAQQVGLQPGGLIWSSGDTHVYLNHLDQVKEQLGREPYPFPTVKINKAKSIFDYTIDDFTVENYQHHPAIKAPVAV